MSSDLNRAQIIGRLGADPDVRHAGSGVPITTIRCATTKKWKDKNGEKQERTEWHRVQFFGPLAEIAGKYLKKGSQAYIEGELRTDEYTDKEGIKRYSTSILAEEMKMLGGKSEGAS